MPRRLAPLLLALLLVLALLPAVARADGFIVVDDPAVRAGPGHFPFAPLEVVYHRVTVDIDNGVAVTTVDQAFRNPSGRRTEGTYLFPLPDGASIDRFSMDVDGTMTDAELLPADAARKIYEDIVRKQRDPALLEYAGRGAFKARVFPIEPNGTKRIKLRYTQVLTPDSGATDYRYSLNTEKFSATPLKEVSVTVHLKSDRPLKSIYCPSHNVEVKRDGDRAATVSYEETDARPDADFKLIYAADPDPVGITLLTHRPTPAEDGYFLLMASPGERSADAAVQPKDVCFVLDTSGSMAGPKLEQAGRALLFCLANLNAADRFNIVRFSTEAEPLFAAMAPADAEHVAEARAFVGKLKPIGGTAIEAALNAAADLRKASAGGGRPFVTLFLTDGQPTIGETDEDALVRRAADLGRTFPFGLGADVNTHLLDRVAGVTGAFSQYVGPTEDIEVKVSDFYAKIQSPVMNGVKLAIEGGGVRASAVYPSDLPDLYKGQTLLAFGRYSGDGPAAVRVSGTVDGRTVTLAQDVTFPKTEAAHDFIPKLWATRRVGWLLDEIRLRGESDELREEVTRLARAHGIVTPYTAYLIIEDESRRNVPVASQTLRELNDDAATRDRAEAMYRSAPADSPALAKTGPQAMATAKDVGEMRRSENAQQGRGGAGAGLDKAASGGAFGVAGGPATQPAEMGYRAAQSQNYSRQAAAVNGRAFYRNGEVWSDARLQASASEKLPRQAVAFASADYCKLLDAHPDAAKWLALGPQVDLILDGTVYNVR